jgi:hypothetical protein
MIIFLDFDGVLNKTEGINATYKKTNELFDKENIKILNEILRENYKIKIVVTSSWRDILNEAIFLLNKVGFLYEDRIIGKTIRTTNNNRGKEIDYYLKTNNIFDKYIILEDDKKNIYNIEQYIDQKHIFKIDPKKGLTKKDKEDILNYFFKKEICINCNSGKVVKWCYMPGYSDKRYVLNDYHCEDCVPRGCSCNNIDFKDIDKNNLNKEKFKAINYGSKIHERGKELEIIEDQNTIKVLANNLTEKQLSNFELVPLDNNGKEFPCCEYFYEENGFLFEK